LLERCGHRDWRLPSSFRPGGLTPVRSPCSHPSEFSFFFVFFFFLLSRTLQDMSCNQNSRKEKKNNNK
jgi:hypothetical protein